MATTSTLSEWTEQLAFSFLPPSSGSSARKSRRSVELFRRRIQHHNYARTNQFDVSDRLDGLEEKLQILSRDDISDALHKRRLELRENHENWIPDILDLLLRLSDNPLRTTKLQNLSDFRSLSEPTPLLKWADIESDDPFDRNDPIWRVPDFSDLSSDEDEPEGSTATTSPASVKHRAQSNVNTEKKTELAFDAPDLLNAANTLLSIPAVQNDLPTSCTEIELIRQVLLMVQGYSCSSFETYHGRPRLASHVKLKSVSRYTLQELIGEVSSIRNNLDAINTWIGQATSNASIRAIKQMVEETVNMFLSSVCALEEELLHPKSVKVVSLMQTAAQVADLGHPLAILGRWVQRVHDPDPVASLDVLYEAVCECYFANDTLGSDLLTQIFLTAFGVYMRPIWAWLDGGILTPDLSPFFIHSKNLTSSVPDIWHNSFELILEGPDRAPLFLKPFEQDIMACGKTAAFISHIRQGKDISNSKLGGTTDLAGHLQKLVSDPAIPFPTGFVDALKSHFSSSLASATLKLKNLLDTECGLSRTFDAFDYIFLRKQGVVLDMLEARIFSRIDRCIDNWNDRFLIADMLEDIYVNVDSIDLSSIMVHSTYTSSRSMQSRRRSVRILNSLAIDYTLPWPVANIISKSSLAAYRRISLHLLQIRRAKYVLDRVAYPQVNSAAISEDPRDQLLAQATTFVLLHCVNTLYDHFTTGIVLPMTTKMRRDLQIATTVDAMIAVHESYIASLEFACLTTRQMKVLRETLIGLLDLCIRFADLLSSPNNPTDHRSGSVDLETGSFVSAQSRRRRPKRRRVAIVSGKHDSSSEDDDDDSESEGQRDPGDGYSSFIVLEPDTSVVQEIRKLRSEFKRQLEFFVAGLRGVGKGGTTVEEFEMLAARL